MTAPGSSLATRTLALLFAVSITFASDSANSQEISGDALDEQVYWILKNKCAKCHDDLGDNAASGEGDLLNLEDIYTYYLDPTDEELVNDLVLSDHARMPKPKYDDIEWNGPLTLAEKATIREWINRGGASEEYTPRDAAEPRALITIRETIEAIAADLQKLSGTELENARISH